MPRNLLTTALNEERRWWDSFPCETSGEVEETVGDLTTTVQVIRQYIFPYTIVQRLRDTENDHLKICYKDSEQCGSERKKSESRRGHRLRYCST